MKAILINAKTDLIEETEIDGSLESIYNALGVSMIEIAGYLDNGDHIYVDEEGLINGHNFGFSMKNSFSNPQPFAGCGLVLRSTRSGKETSCKSSVDEMRTLVSFW